MNQPTDRPNNLTRWTKAIFVSWLLTILLLWLIPGIMFAITIYNVDNGPRLATTVIEIILAVIMIVLNIYSMIAVYHFLRQAKGFLSLLSGTLLFIVSLSLLWIAGAYLILSLPQELKEIYPPYPRIEFSPCATTCIQRVIP